MLQKRAGLNLSVSTIVIVVIAMAVLGLGLAFTKNVFTFLGGTVEELDANTKGEIRKFFADNNAKLYFPRDNVNVGKGEEIILAYGVKNTEDNSLNYKIRFMPGEDPEGNLFEIDRWFQFNKGERSLSPTEFNDGPIKLRMPRDTNSGSYSLTIEVVDLDTNEVYAWKDFFVVVTS